MGIFNKNKKIVVYVLANKHIKNKFLTLSDNRSDIVEYLMIFMQLKHKDHFESWCEIRELDKADVNNWFTYYNDCVDIEEKFDFQLLKVKYTVKDIMVIMRMFGNCFPIGCSFEKEAERAYFNFILTKDTINKEDELKEDNSNGIK